MAQKCYEAMVVYSLKGSEASIEPLAKKFTDLIAQNGELLDVKNWGKRYLRYNIQKEREGYYAIYTFYSEPSFPQELNRIAGITDGVLRILVTSSDPSKIAAPAVPAAPAVAAEESAEAPAEAEAPGADEADTGTAAEAVAPEEAVTLDA
ncbi:MAG: 30S ribosomal protein S6 [Oscillospiraceae bacterium]|jgi:small subunit ribosomal protein S6|nr:30S ribosomal protein S6 [Oscillospiraceae bacterium]